MISDTSFDYAEMVGRNLGFVSAEEQGRLRDATVFVCGVGGMGGACLQSLVRAGLGGAIVADFDHFEVSNLNRQVFADLASVGRDKVDATAEALLRINPELRLVRYGRSWGDHLDEILSAAPLVVNGMDDVAAGIHLYRRARDRGATVIDAYTSPLPSVTVIGPGDPRPEDRMGYPSRGLAVADFDEAILAGCLRREIEYVLVHSSSRHHLDLDVAAQMVAGERPRMSLAPMVITAGNLMAFEALNVLLGRPSGTDHRGYFFNPWTVRVERPRGRLAAGLLGFVVRRFLDRMLNRAAGSETRAGWS